MKKIFFISLLAIGSSLFTFCRAQQEFGQIVINAGVGYSPEFNGEVGDGLSGNQWYPVKTVLETLPSYGTDYPPIYNCSSILPNIGGTIDVGLSKFFSIGIASSYQSETVNWAVTNSMLLNFSDKITRINMALRFLYHLPWKHKRFDPYFGVRTGESFWKDIASLNNTVPSGYYGGYFLKESNLIVPSFQVLGGMRIYLVQNFGINIEAGMGSPYLLEGGLTFRINTHKITPQINTPQDSYGGHEINK